MKSGYKRFFQILLVFAAFIVLVSGIRRLQRYDLRCETVAKVTPYLEDVNVQLLGKCDDVYYFLVDSSNIGELNTGELKELYDAVKLEKVNVIFTSEGKQYYLLPEGERKQVKFLSPD